MVDDFTNENGATRLLPSSHHSDLAPSKEFFEKNCETITGKAGDILLFDSLVWHAGGYNKTKNSRRGLTLVYSRSFMKQQIDICQAMSSKEIQQLSPRIQQRVGFDVRVPRSMEEFRLPENRRIYKANQG